MNKTKLIKFKSYLTYSKKFLTYYHIKFFLSSIRAFVINSIHLDNPFRLLKKRKNGISVLLPTQNEELIVKISILSFLDFADEIIVVDNGSVDNTKEIIRDLAEKYPKIKFFDKPELPDLNHNRQFALKQSQYRWICRFDSDFVAYTNGKNNILKLRKKLLNMPRSIIPKVIGLNYVNIGGDFWHTQVRYFNTKINVIEGPRLSIYEYFPLFTFFRFGRREYGSFQFFMNNIIVKPIFFMHCMIKSKVNLFLRSERTNWREFGKFRKYPTLFSYIKNRMEEKYHTTNIKNAIEIFLKEEIYKREYYIEYDPKKYLPYPSLIAKEMEKENVFRISKFF